MTSDLIQRVGPIIAALSAADLAKCREEKRRLQEVARIAAEKRGYTLHHKLVGVTLS